MAKPFIPKPVREVIAQHEAGMHDRKPKPDVCRDCARIAALDAAEAPKPAPEPIKVLPARKPKVAIDPPEVAQTTPSATRESWMLAAVDAMRPWLAEVGAPVGPVRISFGWPGGRGSKVGVRGQCWMPVAVADGVPTIFISPDQTAEDTETLLGIILHEMNHAAGHWGHTGDFAKTADALGYMKPWTDSTGKTDALKARLQGLAERLGPMDHGAIKPETWLPGTRRMKLDPITGEPTPGGPPVQTTRMLKVSCPDDGYTLRATTKWLDVAVPVCPICGRAMDVQQKEK